MCIYIHRYIYVCMHHARLTDDVVVFTDTCGEGGVSCRGGTVRGKEYRRGELQRKIIADRDSCTEKWFQREIVARKNGL